MADKAHTQTEAILTQTLQRLRRLYDKANRQIADEVDFEGLWLDDPEATQRERVRYAERNGLDEAVVAIVLILVASNKTAISYLNKRLDSVFDLNMEYVWRDIESASGVKFSVSGAYSTSRFTRRAYREMENSRYLRREVEKAFRQGFHRGEDIRNIRNRIMGVGNVSRNQATTIARTEVTRAQNSGRNKVFDAARKDGIKGKKKWIATNDGRTRHSHAFLNGELREVGEPYSNGLMFPGDPNGSAEEVVNCRCTEVFEVE